MWMPDFRHFRDLSLQEIVSSRKSWHWIFLQFIGITFVVAGRNMCIAFHFRIPSQDQIVYMTKGNTYIKDLMLNHTFQVMWKTFAELHYSEKSDCIYVVLCYSRHQVVYKFNYVLFEKASIKILLKYPV